MSDATDREVRYDIYCPLCKYEKLDGNSEPCDECLEQFTNVDSDRPTRFEPKEKKK